MDANVVEFIRDWNRHSVANPVGDGRVLKMCVICLVCRSRMPEVTLSSIRALMPRQGHGTMAMVHLMRLADKHHVTIKLVVCPFGKEKRMDERQLVRWYRSMGFSKPDITSHMYREPNQCEEPITTDMFEDVFSMAKAYGMWKEKL